MIIDLLDRFEPDSEGLLREISKHIDDEMLEWISTADYGCRADEHIVALRQVRDAGTFPQEMHWCPMEVLELIRWSEPEDPEWKSGRTGEFGHWMRVFSCAAILRAEHEPYNYSYNDGSTDSTVIQMIMSLRALPVDFTSQAVKHLAWLLLHSDPEGRNDQVRVYGVGLLWFALQIVPTVPDETLISLARWVVRRADELDWKPTAGGWSGLREMVLNCQKKSAWELLGCEFCNLDLKPRSSDLQVWVEVIGEQLVG
jgi:hypothetical protein